MVWPERRRGEVGRWGRGVEKAKKREEVLLNQRQSKGESWGKREKKKKVFDCRYEEEKKSDFFDMSEDDVLSKEEDYILYSREQCTNLHLAILDGKSWEVEKLLQMGANPNAVNRYGQTPLHFAKKRKSDITHLLNHGANPSLRDNGNNTPLSCYLSRGFKDECAENLPLFFSNTTEINYQSNYDGSTFLHHLLERLGDWREKKREEYRYWDAEFEEGTTRELLLNLFASCEGVDPSIADFEGVTPLCIALQLFQNLECTWESISLLMNQIQKINPEYYKKNSQNWTMVVAKDGSTPLHSLCHLMFEEEREGLRGVFEEEFWRCVDFGVDVCAKDKNGNTILHLLTQKIHHEYGHDRGDDVARIIQQLLELGGDVHAKNNRGLTPLFVVLSKRLWNDDVVGVLIAGGSDVRGIFQVISSASYNNNPMNSLQYLSSCGVIPLSVEDDKAIWNIICSLSGQIYYSWIGGWEEAARIGKILSENGTWKQERERFGFVEILTENLFNFTSDYGEEWQNEEDVDRVADVYFRILDEFVGGGGGEVVFSDVGFVESKLEKFDGEEEEGDKFCRRIFERILEGMEGRCKVFVKG